MDKIILESKNQKDSEIIIELASRLGLKVVKEPKKRKINTAKALGYLAIIAKRAKIAKQIKDPVKWQREIRKDRKLPYR
jgi:hypothetical protein